MGNYTISFFYFYSIILFLVSILGLITARRNYFLLIISLEIFFIAINLNFLMGSLYLDDIGGIIFSVFLLVVSGAEVAIGLALFILIYKKSGSYTAYNMINIKG